MSERAARGPACILVADDEEPLARLIAEHLGRQGHTVRTVHDGDAALREGSAAGWDLLLLDVHMPGLSGIEVVEALSRANALPPTLVMSAYGTMDTALAAVRAGALDFVQKPFRMAALDVKVGVALEQARQRRPSSSRLRPVSPRVSAPQARDAAGAVVGTPGPESSLSIPAHTAALEQRLIREALRRTEGNRTHAATLLEISTRGLHQKISRYDIDIPAPVGRPRSKPADDKA